MILNKERGKETPFISTMARLTKQKSTLLNAVNECTSFFNASTLEEKTRRTTKNNHKNIGLATIYRFLATLEQTGTLHAFTCNGKKVYSTNKTSHAHYTCEHCKTTKHLSIKNADFLHQITEDDICHFQLELAGTCKKCKEKEEKKI